MSSKRKTFLCIVLISFKIIVFGAFFSQFRSFPMFLSTKLFHQSVQAGCSGLSQALSPLMGWSSVSLPLLIMLISPSKFTCSTFHFFHYSILYAERKWKLINKSFPMGQLLKARTGWGLALFFPSSIMPKKDVIDHLCNALLDIVLTSPPPPNLMK